MQPIATEKIYAKYGFVLTRWHCYKCPTCGEILNAGPDWMPPCCEECGQSLDWSQAVWAQDDFLGYMEEGA